MIYFTADMHFYHDKIIRHVNRPFYSAEEMNKALIKKWNNKVSGSDTVYILGDVTMKGPELAAEALKKLNGRKHLIRGNHDRFAGHSQFDKSLFESIQDYAEVAYHNTRFILFHYPIAEWNGIRKGNIHLHGHQHNHSIYNYDNLEKGIRRFDVGVDANDMAPVGIEEIIAFFQMMP